MMCPARLSELLHGANIHPLQEPGSDPLVSGATLDSRSASPGDLFLALPGFHVDGAGFAADAIERGAVAVLSASPRPATFDRSVAWVQVEAPRRDAGLLSRECYGRPDEALTLVGITGTNGKTTVSYLVESIAVAAGRRAGRLGTVGASFGDAELATTHTTPEAPEFYRLLARMRDEKVDVVSIEVSSHALSLHRVEGAKFDVAAFLNLTRDHLDFHRTTEAYFEAKASLFDRLDDDAWAILPEGDPHAERIAARTPAKVTTFGESEGADLRLEQVHCGLDGSSAVLQTPSGPLPLRTHLIGRFNLDNVVAAAGCALALGLPVDAITSGVLALPRVPGRMERVDRGQPFHLLVDYAHTEDALRNLLGSLRPLTRGRLIVVFGCGGDRDQGKRAPMGQAAAELADVLFVTSDNPRNEDPEEIVEQIVQGVRSVPGAADRCQAIVDRRQAIHAAVASASAGDVVALAGKGHEATVTRAGSSQPLDDRVVAAEALECVGYGGNRA